MRDEGLRPFSVRFDAASRSADATGASPAPTVPVPGPPIDQPGRDAAVADPSDGAPPLPPGDPVPEGPAPGGASDAGPPPVDAAPPPADAGPPPVALLLVGDDDLSAGDAVLSRRLALLGFRVQARQVLNEGMAPAALQAARGAALVVVSSSLPTGTGVARQTGELPVPILCSSPVFLDDLGISVETEEGDVQGNQIALRILAPQHPLAAGRAGRVAVVRNQTLFGSARITGDAIPIAALLFDDDDVSIVALEKGARSTFGPAPARRVGWFALESTFLGLTPDGWALFDAAVHWLVPPP